MSKRTTISIPDDLHERMQRWKKEINFSGEFQEFIKRIIDKKERQQKQMAEGINLDEAIKRLREQKKESRFSYFEKGEVDGYHWAATTDFDELTYALKWEPWNQQDSWKMTSSYTPTGNKVLGKYFAEKIKSDVKMKFEEGIKRNPLPNEYYANWEEGWVKGVKKFWEDVKDKL